MSLPLSVSSFPDPVSTTRQLPFSPDKQASGPTTRRGRIKSLFGIQSPPAIPEQSTAQEPLSTPHSNVKQRLDPIQTSGLFLSHRPAVHGDFSDSRIHYSTRTHVPSSEQCLPQTDAETYFHIHQNPRSTKESIAHLGLAPRSFTPDPQLTLNSDEMVTTCSHSGYVETPPLPPLPPLPPPSPVSQEMIIYDTPNRTSSLARHNDPYADNDAFIVETSADDEHPDGSSPPSPIMFSHRISSYVAAGSAHVPTCDEARPPETHMASKPSVQSRTTASTPQLGLSSPPKLSMRAAAMMALPWTRAYPPPPSVFISPSPQTSSCSNPLKLLSWAKIFWRRKHGPSETQSRPSSKPPIHRPQTIHIGPNSCDFVFVEDDETPDSARPYTDISPEYDVATFKFPEPEEENLSLSRMTTHHAIGNVWEEKDVGEIISTLRTMKVSGKLKR